MRQIARVSAAVLACAAAYCQQPGGVPVLKTEGRLVLVDAVVTDKKGHAIRDLTAKDFRVWEDDEEQKISNVSLESLATASPEKSTRYLLLFFDNSTMQTADQMNARIAATKFIEANSGPGRLIAIADYGGSVHITQNFTNDTDRLKKVVAGLRGSYVSPNAGTQGTLVAGMPALNSVESDFGARTVLLAIRTLARNLATVPGRKTLVMLSAGFALNPELQSELTAAISACNRANVAIYPIDVRGLVAPVNAGHNVLPAPASFFGAAGFWPGSLAFLMQKPGGAPAGGMGGGSQGGGSHAPGGGTTAPPGGGTGSKPSPSPGSPGGGKSGGTTSAPGRGPVGSGVSRNPTPDMRPYQYNPYANQIQRIIPNVFSSVAVPQQVLYMLADGTGGFVIANSNDLVAGLEKIARDLNEYYVISYIPESSEEGQCHQLKVKVNQGGAVVRARTGYCTARPVEVLAGTPAERDLEKMLSASAPGSLAASMQAPYFYSAPDTARVNVSIDLPLQGLSLEKKKGKFHAAMNVLGVAYRPDGTVGARFSDTVNLEFGDKKQFEEYARTPFHYENQFEIAAGQYALKVVFSSAPGAFGKVEIPLAIDSYDGKKFSLSAMALSNQIRDVSDMDTSLTAQLLDDRKPLVTSGKQVTPSGSNRFKSSDVVAFYAEVYDPLLAEREDQPAVGVQMRIVDRKTGQQKIDSGLIRVGTVQHGNPVIPIGVRVPVQQLGAGSYRLEVKAVDVKGNTSPIRTAEVEVQD
jgi:VWFA-related protein